MSEYVDLYDSNRLKLNKTIERKSTPSAGQYVVVVHGILINKAGEILIQRRVATKKNWPNLWDLSCSGAISAGESSQEGLEREIAEELGVKIELTDTPPTLTTSYEHGFSDYYVLPFDAPIEQFVVEPKEVSNLQWITPDKLFDLLKTNQFVPYNETFLKALLELYKDGSEIKDT